jgi:hypothetical protein
MFCRGCLGKLPAFAPTGPSLLKTTPPKNPLGAPYPRVATRNRLLRAETLAPWLSLGMVLLLLLGLVAWYTTTVHAPKPQVAAQPVAPAAVLPPEQPVEEILVSAKAPAPAVVEEAPAWVPPVAVAPAPAAVRHAALAIPHAAARPLRKEHKQVQAAAPLMGAAAACDRYNPFGEVLCTHRGYPTVTYASRHRG